MRPFGVSETHGMLALAGVSNRRSSDGLGWRSLYMSSQTERPFRGSFTARDPLVVFHRDEIVGYMDLSRSRQVYAPAGSVRLVAPDAPFDAELCQTADTIHLYIRQAIWNDVAMEVTDKDPSKVPFEGRLIEAEPMLTALCMAGLGAMLSGDAEPLFTDHLARCIASHIMAVHLGIKPHWRTTPTGRILSPEVVRAIDFIEAHADRSIGLAEIAAAACRSQSHLARIFSAETGLPPHRYLIGVRIRRARHLLAKTRKPIAEIALDCGFTHQEHLTRIFQKHFETTPAAYRRSVQGG
ncbi:AraC family transcriptional regulator [Devosia enhydra]|uniref:AraC family transcriptional regulator n=1 Tax=Devosia enhydra TaxID=665118 RepID=A0A1K2I3D4_9HYPH|nr:AraC family transcriptional regulator [Devosia enhydra]SFZ86840.1 AraC family transcriptional regulator [Devosia enhydra]